MDGTYQFGSLEFSSCVYALIWGSPEGLLRVHTFATDGGR